MGEEKRRDYGFFAKIISVIFHPVIMPFYALIIILFAPTLLAYLPPEVKKIVVFVFFTNNVALSISAIPFLRFRNTINSWAMEEKSERVIPLLIASVLYFVTSYILFRFQVPVFLKAFAFSYSILVLICAVISTRWKISIHAAGSGALVATLVLLSFKMDTYLGGFIVTAILISGLVLSARLRLNSHKPAEIYAGFITGLLVVGCFMLLF